MIEALHLGSMLPATLGACCVAGTADRRSPFAWAAMVLMLVAMLDAVVFRLLPGVLWSTLLVALAIVTVAIARRTGRVTSMTAHRALQLVVMAALLGTATHSADGPAISGHSAHAMSGMDPMVFVSAGAAGFVGYSLWLVRHVHPPVRWRRLEVALGAASVSAMSVAMLLG